MVTSGIGNAPTIDADKALETMGVPQREEREAPTMDQGGGGGASAPASEGQQSATENDNDPMKALLDSVKKDAAGDKKP